MNDEQNNGGSAFPHEDGQYEGDNDARSHGMSLRDYFAGRAMQALLPSPDFDAVATHAYMQADAMLRARKECT